MAVVIGLPATRDARQCAVGEYTEGLRPARPDDERVAIPAQTLAERFPRPPSEPTPKQVDMKMMVFQRELWVFDGKPYKILWQRVA